MKVKTISIVMLSLFLIGGIGCKRVVNYKMKLKLTKLSPSDIYDKKIVGDAIFDAQELKVDSLKNKSNKLFLQGVDLYKNKKDPAKAIEVFKKSLLVFPTVETYYEIGEALMALQANQRGEDKKGSLRETIQAYGVAEYLNYQPVSFVYYNMACAHNLLGNDDTVKSVDKISFHLNQAVFDLRNAFMNGFSDTAMLQKDMRLNSIMKTDAYKQMIAELNAQKNANAKPETVFDLYKASFPNIKQPFIIPVDSVDMAGYRISISFDFARFIPEMENTSFGRDVSHDYYVVGKLGETPLYTAIIFTSTELGGEGPDFNAEPVYTKLVTYTPEGNIIDSRLISCRCTMDKAKALKIENNIITSEEYSVTWKYTVAELDSLYNKYQNMDEYKMPENKVVKSELINKEVYKLTDIGKIVVTDSTKVAFK